MDRAKKAVSVSMGQEWNVVIAHGVQERLRVSEALQAIVRDFADRNGLGWALDRPTPEDSPAVAMRTFEMPEVKNGE